MDCIHLIGAEEVQRAGSQMQDAAQTIQNAVNQLSEAMYSLAFRMDNLTAALMATGVEKDD